MKKLQKKYKQKQSSNDMRERKYYKHSQGLIKRAKQDTDTEKRQEIKQWEEQRSNARRMREKQSK